MTHWVALSLHAGLGALALILYWVMMASRKGSPVHRRLGRIELILLVAVAVTVGPLLLSRPVPFDPGVVVQMVYLGTCLTTVSALAFFSIRLKHAPERFFGWAFRIMGPVLLILGLVVLAAGLAKSNWVAVVLSWIGLVYGTGMILSRNQGQSPPPRWFMSWHLNAVSGLFDAVHGTIAFVVYRGLVDPEALSIRPYFHLATFAGAVALRLWLGRRHNAPIGLWPRPDRRPSPALGQS